MSLKDIAEGLTTETAILVVRAADPVNPAQIYIVGSEYDGMTDQEKVQHTKSAFSLARVNCEYPELTL